MTGEKPDETIDEVRAELALLRQLVAFILAYGLPDSVLQKIDRKLAEDEAGRTSGSGTLKQRVAKRMREEIAINLAANRAAMK